MDLSLTCKLNGVETYAYLRDTLKTIAAGHPQSRLTNCCPVPCGSDLTYLTLATRQSSPTKAADFFATTRYRMPKQINWRLH